MDVYYHGGQRYGAGSYVFCSITINEFENNTSHLYTG